MLGIGLLYFSIQMLKESFEEEEDDEDKKRGEEKQAGSSR